MSTDDRNTLDPKIVEELAKWDEEDAALEVKKQEIDMQRSELSEQWAEADERGDIRLCEVIERRMRELLKARRQLG